MTRASNVMVVDDDVDFRGVLVELLHQEHCTVFEASNGRDALTQLRAFVPDLIFVDLMMPVMSGWEFLSILAEDPCLASVPVAVLSAVARMRPLGASCALQKPIDLPVLLALLDALDAPEHLHEAAHT